MQTSQRHALSRRLYRPVYLSRSADGRLAIKSMIREDIQAAAARGERERALALKRVLRNYVSERRGLD